MRFITDIAVGLACLSAALAILTYLRKRHNSGLPALRAWIAAIVAIFAVAASQLIDLAALFAPGAVWLEFVQAITLIVALGVSIRVWVLLPALLKEPSAAELLAVNKELSEALARRAEEVGRLAAVKVALERTVAERGQALNENKQRFDTALKNSDISMAQQDPDLRYIWVYNAPKGLSAATLLGRLQKDVLPPETDKTLSEAKRGVMASKKAANLEIEITIEGVGRHFHENIEPLWRDGEVIGVLTTCVETTAYRRRQEELRALLRELTHRTKNLLAVIMGIARQSGRSSPEVARFVARFNGRIRALAVTHELLVESEWRGVGLHALIEGIWQAGSPESMDRLTLVGEEMALAPESAQNLALAIHEMQGGAIARGSLLGPGFGVTISWSRLESATGVTMVWEETGRASLLPEDQDDNFGKSFVEVLLPRATRGRSSVQTHETGLTWTLTLPATTFVPQTAQP